MSCCCEQAFDEPFPWFRAMAARYRAHWPRSWYPAWRDEPTKSERKEALEAAKRHLEERLAEISDELGAL